jgi:hypothetical protein
MRNSACLFEFDHAVPIDEVAGTFELALMGVESLYGPARVALDAVYRIDRTNRTIEIDRSSDVGGTLALVFLGYARREFGDAAVRMKRVEAPLGETEGAPR